jgi:DNA invertase Pin-like site-specific DNA recombinase
VITTDEQLHHCLAAAIKIGVWGYVRVSSDKQEDGQSPEAQCDEIRAYCASVFPDRVLTIVQETASAAMPMFSIALPGMKATGPMTLHEAPRPLLGMLLATLCDRPGSHLVVWKLDRLARVATEQEMFLSLLRRHEVTVHTAYAGERHLVEGTATADQDPVRHLMRQILACFAEYERRLIHMRMAMGSRKKASKGGWIGGHRPYGYNVANGDLVVNPTEAAVILEVFRLRDVYLYTYQAIGESLALSRGITGFHKVKILRVLSNRRLYSGIYDDPYGKAHIRLDLKILPESWDRPDQIVQHPMTSAATPDEVPSYDGQ